MDGGALMTLPKSMIGDKGQRFVARAGGYPEDGTNVIGWADTWEAARDLVWPISKAPGCWGIEIVERVNLQKSMDADIEHLIDTLGTDAEINEDFDCADGEMSLDARRLETTARRLVREAGYALPETATGG